MISLRVWITRNLFLEFGREGRWDLWKAIIYRHLCLLIIIFVQVTVLHRDTYCAETVQTSKPINTEVGRYVQVNTTRNQNEQTRTYQACPSSCNLERSATKWYAVSHGIRIVWSSVRENNVLNLLYTKHYLNRILKYAFGVVCYLPAYQGVILRP